MKHILDYVMTSLLAEISCMSQMGIRLDKGKEFDSDKAGRFIMEFQVHLMDESTRQG